VITRLRSNWGSGNGVPKSRREGLRRGGGWEGREGGGGGGVNKHGGQRRWGRKKHQVQEEEFSGDYLDFSESAKEGSTSRGINMERKDGGKGVSIAEKVGSKK